MVKLLQENLSGQPETSYCEDRRPMDWKFWLIGVEDVDREHQFVCGKISGTHNSHSVRSISAMDVNKLLIKNLACFCDACIDENWSECINVEWYREWRVEMLRMDNVG